MIPLARVGDLAKQIRGVSYRKGDAATSPRPGFLPVLRAGNISDDRLVFKDLVFVPAERISDKQRIRRHDVVIATSSGSLDVVGKAASATDDFDGGFGAFCKVLRPGPKVHPRYFAHFFKTIEYRRRTAALAAGANINNLRNEHLDDLEIPLPSLPEQRRIAEVLDRADALRAKRRTALAELDTLTQAIFVEMFGDPVTNPKGWPTAALGDTAVTTSGGTPNRDIPEYYGGSVPWVKSGELHGGIVAESEEFLTERGVSESSAKIMPPDTVLVAMYGATAGVVATLTIAAATNQAICSVQPNDEIKSVYLAHLLEQLTPSLLAKRVGGAQPNLSQKLLRALQIIVPPVHLQSQFSCRVAAVEKLKTAHRASLAEMDALFASLQDRAFRGEL